MDENQKELQEALKPEKSNIEKQLEGQKAPALTKEEKWARERSLYKAKQAAKNSNKSWARTKGF